MKKINWGIIGLGNIAHKFSKAFAETNNAKLLAISSKDENKVKEINAHGDVKIIREGLSINGDEARYDPIQNKLFVFGEVEVLQNQSVILCDKIIVDLENSSSIMSSDSNKRVEALIIN